MLVMRENWASRRVRVIRRRSPLRPSRLDLYAAHHHETTALLAHRPQPTVWSKYQSVVAGGASRAAILRLLSRADQREGWSRTRPSLRFKAELCAHWS